MAGPVHLIAHVAVETYSVLTRLPAAQRVPGALARAYLRARFEAPLVGLAPDACEAVLDLAARGGIEGGAIYDAVVGITAERAGATLLTLDRRATPTYDKVGVAYRLL